MAIKQQVMALNPARKGNMGRLNSSQPLYVYDTTIAQPWLKGCDCADTWGRRLSPA